MAVFKYSCPLLWGDPPVKKCDFKSNDSRILVNHCLEVHSEIVGVCHEVGCEGQVFRAPDKHWEDIHAGASECAFCGETLSNYAAFNVHLRIHHQQQMGYVNARVPPLSQRLSLESTVKLFVAAPTLKYIPLRENFGIFYDSTMQRPVMGAELLLPDVLKESVTRPRPISFKHNLQLPETQVTLQAINHLGYAGAHILPCDDWSWDYDDFNATFDNLNLTAMVGYVNSGKWNSGVENNVRKVGMSSLATLALTICHYDPSAPPRRSLSKLVHVPTSFSKIVYCDKGNGWLGQVVNVKNEENRDGRVNFWSHKCSFEELHQLNMSGITLEPVVLTWEEKVKFHRCKDYTCSASYYDYQQYVEHKQTHGVKCSRCSRVFKTKDLLQLHTNGCYLRCVFCDKPFKGPSQLAVHERTHTNERPFVCTLEGCGKGFTSRGHLTEHLLTHGPKQYFCSNENCDKAFAQSFQRNRHMWTHYDVKRYKCSECDQESSRKESIQLHQQRKLRCREGTVIESEEWKTLAKRLKEEAEEAAAMND